MDLRLIELTRIVEDPEQPRRAIDEETLAGLADSIRQHGVLNPITVTPLEGVDGFRIVTGERRWRAAQMAGLYDIPCIVRDEGPGADERATEQLVENLQREDLAPLDEAESLAALKARHGYSLEDLARVLAKAKSTLSELLSLNDLAESIKAEVRTSERPVPKSVLIEVARAGDAVAQERLWATLKAVARPTVRSTRHAKQPAPPPGRAVAGASRRLLDELDRLGAEAVRGDPALRQLLDRLQARLAQLLAG